MKTCPNVNSFEWKKLVDTVGEGMAWASYIKFQNILEVVDADVNIDKLAQSLGLKDAKGISLAKTKSLKSKLDSKYLNVEFVETVKDGKYLYDLEVLPLREKAYYNEIFKENYPNIDEMINEKYVNSAESENTESVDPAITETLIEKVKQTDKILDNIIDSITTEVNKYKQKLSKLRNEITERTNLVLNNLLARILPSLQQNTSISINSQEGAVISQMFGNLESPNMLATFITNKGLIEDFLVEGTNQFMSNEEILTKMFDVTYLEGLSKESRKAIELRTQLFLDKVQQEIKTTDFTEFVNAAMADTNIYNDAVENSEVTEESPGMLDDDAILSSAEFQVFNSENPNTTLEENLEYYKMCKL